MGHFELEHGELLLECRVLLGGKFRFVAVKRALMLAI